MDDRTVAVLQWTATVDVQIEAGQQPVEGDLTLESCQWCSDAVVDPVAEGQMRVAFSRDVEAVGLAELTGPTGSPTSAGLYLRAAGAQKLCQCRNVLHGQAVAASSSVSVQQNLRR